MYNFESSCEIFGYVISELYIYLKDFYVLKKSDFFYPSNLAILCCRSINIYNASCNIINIIHNLEIVYCIKCCDCVSSEKYLQYFLFVYLIMSL